MNENMTLTEGRNDEGAAGDPSKSVNVELFDVCAVEGISIGAYRLSD